MCETCEGCECLDKACCPNRDKCIFLGCFTIAHGLLLVIFTYYEIDAGTKEPTQYLVGVIYLSLVAFVHLTAGLLILVGVYTKYKYIILLGAMLSFLYPVMEFYLGYLLVVHIMLTVSVKRYALELQKKKPNT